MEHRIQIDDKDNFETYEFDNLEAFIDVIKELKIEGKVNFMISVDVKNIDYNSFINIIHIVSEFSKEKLIKELKNISDCQGFMTTTNKLINLINKYNLI
jgi:hypothetical protein